MDTRQNLNTLELTKMALLTTLIYISAYIMIPLSSSLASLIAQTLVIGLIAFLLIPRQTALITVVYMLLDLSDPPVFSGGVGGPGKLFGSTNGCIMAWLAAVVLMSWLKGKRYSFRRYCLVTMLAGMPVTLILGSIYMKFVTGMD